MHLMFLSNNSLQNFLHAGAYRLVIISVAAAHVRLVIFTMLVSIILPETIVQQTRK